MRGPPRRQVVRSIIYTRHVRHPNILLSLKLFLELFYIRFYFQVDVCCRLPVVL